MVSNRPLNVILVYAVFTSSSEALTQYPGRERSQRAGEVLQSLVPAG